MELDTRVPVPQIQGHRRRGLLYPIKPEPGSIGAQPVVYKFSFLFFTRFETGFLHFGVAILCLISQPMR